MLLQIIQFQAKLALFEGNEQIIHKAKQFKQPGQPSLSYTDRGDKGVGRVWVKNCLLKLLDQKVYID